MKKTRFDLSLLAILVVILGGRFYLSHLGEISTEASQVEVTTYGNFFAPTIKAYQQSNLVASQAATLADQLTSAAAIVIDTTSKQVLFAKNPDQSFYPASTTKMVTALVARDLYELTTPITITQQDLAQGSSLGLQVGETVTIQGLLEALLIPSANEAGTTLANHSPWGFQDFVARMNLKVQQLGLTHTHFTNPQGYDDAAQQSTARDLAMISFALLKDPELARIVALPNSQLTTTAGRSINLTSTNQLYSLPHPYQVRGVKTGTERLAQEVLASLLTKDRQEVLIVVLSAENRYNDTLSLANFVFENFVWHSPKNSP